MMTLSSISTLPSFPSKNQVTNSEDKVDLHMPCPTSR